MDWTLTITGFIITYLLLEVWIIATLKGKRNHTFGDFFELNILAITASLFFTISLILIKEYINPKYLTITLLVTLGVITFVAVKYLIYKYIIEK